MKENIALEVQILILYWTLCFTVILSCPLLIISLVRDILLPSFKSGAPQLALPCNPQDIMGISRSVKLEAPPKSAPHAKKEETATKPSAQIPPDKLDKTFTHTEISEAGFDSEYETKSPKEVDTSVDLDSEGMDIDLERNNDHASGVSIEDMNRTARSLNQRFLTQQESREATKVIGKLRDTDLISQWRDSANPQVSKRICEMLDRCDKELQESNSERTITKSRKVNDDFNLDNYIR